MQTKLTIILFLVSTVVSGIPLAYSQETKRTPVFTSEGTQSCVVCHSGEKIRSIRAGIHGDDNPLAEHGCEDCHGPGSFHVSRAHGGRGFPSMIAFGRGADASPRDEQVGACLACHTQSAGDKEAIAFLGSVHDKPFINCSSCHSVHTDVDRIKDKEEQAAICYACHKKTEAEHPRFEDKSIDFEALSCWTCHNVHKLISKN